MVKAGLIPRLRRGALPNSDGLVHHGDVPRRESAGRTGSGPAARRRQSARQPARPVGEDEHGLLRAIKRILPGDDATELVLVIDQFEELFTQVEDEAARVHFLNSLRVALEDPQRVCG